MEFIFAQRALQPNRTFDAITEQLTASNHEERYAKTNSEVLTCCGNIPSAQCFQPLIWNEGLPGSIVEERKAVILCFYDAMHAHTLTKP